jgi:hypothetical protein
MAKVVLVEALYMLIGKYASQYHQIAVVRGCQQIQR